MSHLEGRPELMSEERQRIELPHRFRRQKRRSDYLDGGVAARLLRELLEVRDGHRLFNRALRTSAVEVMNQPATRMRLPADKVRLLQGLHDVRPFLADLRRLWPLRVFADRFLRHFQTSRSPELAYAAVGVVALSNAHALGRMLRS